MEMFPLQLSKDEINIGMPNNVPFDMIKDFNNNALKNHGQSLETLKKRGGLSPKELYAIM